MNPRISVITVTLNAERFIAKCLASVADQGDSVHEHIIVDGGSTDGTIAVVKRFAEKCPHIRWISEPDKGIADAMNKGTALAMGDIIAHLNGDDFYAHGKVLDLVAGHFARNPAARWLTAGFNFVDQSGGFIREIRVRRYSFRRLIRGNILLHPATFFRRDLFQEVGGFNTALSYCMDYDLFLRMAEIAPPLVMDEQLSCFRVHPASRSTAHAEQAYAEEYHVRIAFLKAHGIAPFFYRIDHAIKRRLNKIFYKRLLAAEANAAH